MCWSLFTIIINGNKDIKQVILPTSYRVVTKQPAPNFIERHPAWRLTTLMNALPPGTRLLKSAIDFTYHCDCPKENINKWFDSPIDAAFEMIVLLLKSNKNI